MTISSERLREIASCGVADTSERKAMATELLAARADVEQLRAELDELRTEWFGVAGGENSFPSDRDGDRMAQEQVTKQLADLRAELDSAWDATGVASTVRGLTTLDDVVRTRHVDAAELRAYRERTEAALVEFTRVVLAGDDCQTLSNLNVLGLARDAKEGAE